MRKVTLFVQPDRPFWLHKFVNGWTIIFFGLGVHWFDEARH